MPHDAHDDTPPRPRVYALAARAEIDPRTAERVLVHGPGVIRPRVVRERARRALVELGLLAGEGADAHA